MATILPFVIRNRLGDGPPFIRKASAGALLARRTILQLLADQSNEKVILFIFGCQRSGTTMLSQIFEGDARVSPFAEHNASLSRDDHAFRIRELEEVAKVFRKTRGQLIVAKPLVESQRATEILDYFRLARGLWMYRDYRDVVRSHVKLFDRAGVNIARKIVERADNWASERLPEPTRKVVERFYSEDMSLLDAAALFWWVRNGWFFEQHLAHNDRFALCKYETLVSKPDETMRSIYDFAKLSYPGPHLVNGVHRQSKGLGKSISLDPDIDRLCKDRLEQLDSITGRIAG